MLAIGQCRSPLTAVGLEDLRLDDLVTGAAHHEVYLNGNWQLMKPQRGPRVRQPPPCADLSHPGDPSCPGSFRHARLLGPSWFLGLLCLCLCMCVCVCAGVRRRQLGAPRAQREAHLSPFEEQGTADRLSTGCLSVCVPACGSSALTGRSGAWRAAWGQGGRLGRAKGRG